VCGLFVCVCVFFGVQWLTVVCVYGYIYGLGELCVWCVLLFL